MGLGERHIEEIVELVVNRLQAEGVDISPTVDPSPETAEIADGVFQDIEAAINASDPPGVKNFLPNHHRLLIILEANITEPHFQSLSPLKNIFRVVGSDVIYFQ